MNDLEVIKKKIDSVDGCLTAVGIVALINLVALIFGIFVILDAIN